MSAENNNEQSFPITSSLMIGRKEKNGNKTYTWELMLTHESEQLANVTHLPEFITITRVI